MPSELISGNDQTSGLIVPAPSALPAMSTPEQLRPPAAPPEQAALSVLIVVEPGLDGVFRHVEGLVEYLFSQKVALHLAYSSRRSGSGMLALVERIRAAGGHTLDLRVGNAPEPRDSIAYVRLVALMRRLRPDIVHAHSSKAGALARAAALLVRTPRFIYTPHAYYGMAKPTSIKIAFFNEIERALGGIGKTVNISHDEAEFARKTIHVVPDRISIIHNPVDANRFMPPTAAQRKLARAKLGIPNNAVALATVGRMCWQKDPETAYCGVAPLCAQNPDLFFVHLGWGKWKQYLLNTSQRLGMSSQLKILDYTEDPRSLYHAVDGLLVSSRYEAGWPLVLLEGMASNLPIVAATCPGMSDIGRADLSHLWTFEPESVAGCTAAVREWLRVVREGGRPCNHRAFAVERLSPARCYGAVMDLYLNHPKIGAVAPLAG